MAALFSRMDMRCRSAGPEPAQGEVLVKVKAASINPGEAKIREGLFHAYFPATFPSGVGPGVVGFAAGDEVIGFTDRRGHTLGKIVLLP